MNLINFTACTGLIFNASRKVKPKQIEDKKELLHNDKTINDEIIIKKSRGNKKNKKQKNIKNESDGTVTYYDKKGVLLKRIYSDGMEIHYDENGKPMLCVSPGGLKFWLDDKGNIIDTLA